jgi:hypothetical protein
MKVPLSISIQIDQFHRVHVNLLPVFEESFQIPHQYAPTVEIFNDDMFGTVRGTYLSGISYQGAPVRNIYNRTPFMISRRESFQDLPLPSGHRGGSVISGEMIYH